ncbi:GNAT family N-acetyltransferase [Gordonia hydrophobica]|uniref:GNAT family N-acetyltransferase n=1 Tax=Gordonia hydrophobica TaxID=40516 RepID=A0ABZ2U3A5_9ACTN|nr:GNAT family N-acetyltransferase [Gordonia hydrophobica]MBM7367486.1 putative acetyltransferase [Gordonia hydrophobica]
MSTPISEPESTDPLALERPRGTDWPEILAIDARAFALPKPLPGDEMIEFRNRAGEGDTVVIRDTASEGRPIVAVSLYFPVPVTVPGGGIATTAGLSWVSVSATHRRRGLLRRMLTEQYRTWREHELPLATLTASEGGIYERFGFGPAAFAHEIQVTPSAAEFRTPAPADSRVRYANQDQITKYVPAIHARWARSRTGAITRPDTWWPSIMADRSFRRNSQTSGLHYLLHADGYAAYRIDARDKTALVGDFVAVTPQAHTDLWRVLTGLDLVSAVKASIPVDDPLPLKLRNARAVEVHGRSDELWVSILDVVEALQLRTYGAAGDLVLDVSDDFGDRAGRYRLTTGDDGSATVARTDDDADLALDVATLSSLYLGGITVSQMAAAGRIDGADEAITQLSAMFAVTEAPFSGTFF